MLGGADTVTVSADSVYVNAGIGNDVIYLQGGTNLTVNGGTTEPVTAKAVTILGGGGYDKIDATADKSGDTVATHVYQFGTADGINSIYGFNSNDTIFINAKAAVTADYDSTHTNYVIKAGSTQIYLIFNNKFKAGSSITVKNLNATTGEVQDVPGISVATKLFGTAGADTLNNTVAGYVIDALAGDDTIKNSGNNVSISGGVGNDEIHLIA